MYYCNYICASSDLEFEVVQVFNFEVLIVGEKFHKSRVHNESAIKLLSLNSGYGRLVRTVESRIGAVKYFVSLFVAGSMCCLVVVKITTFKYIVSCVHVGNCLIVVGKGCVISTKLTTATVMCTKRL